MGAAVDLSLTSAVMINQYKQMQAACALGAERVVKHNTLPFRVRGHPAGDLTAPLTFDLVG